MADSNGAAAGPAPIGADRRISAPVAAPIGAATAGSQDLLQKSSPAPAARSSQDPTAPQDDPQKRSSNATAVLVPKGEPDDQRQGFPVGAYFAFCFAINGLVTFLAIFLWSNIGYAEDTLKFLEDEGWLAYVFGAVLVALLSNLYLMDFFWPPHLQGEYLVLWPKDPCVGRFFLLVCFLCFIFACLFCAESYPSVPLLMTIFLSPTLILVLRVKTNPRSGFEDLAAPEELSEMPLHQRVAILGLLTGAERDAHNFYMAAMCSYAVCALISFSIWAPWASQREDDFHAMKSATTSAMQKEKLYIMWSAPLGVAASHIAFFILVAVRVAMARSYEGTNELKNKLLVETYARPGECTTSVLIKARLTKVLNDSPPGPLTEEKKQQYVDMHTSHMRQISRIIKVIGAAILFMLGTLYVAAELVAADSHIALMFQGFLGCFFLTFFAFIFVSFRRLLTAMSSWVQEMPLYRMAYSVSESDWMKALSVASVMPLIPAIVVVSVVNQFIRKLRGTADISVTASEGVNAPAKKAEEKSPTVEEANPVDGARRSGKDFCLTWRVHQVKEAMKKWDWLSMTFKLYVLGVLLVVYVLSPRLLNVGLAALRTALQDLSFGVIMVMVFFSGMCCFLLPPVPGVPVYIFGGIIIADTCPSGFWPGILICIGISFFMKLAACTMQQKLIGETLGQSTAIQQQCGIHKAGIRAIECVLRKKGWSIGKVAILCGGPDWPTSVMAGLLRLPLFQMLLGTVPIILFIAPCVMTGAFYLKQEESEMWNRSGTLMMSLTMVVNIILWALAGWAIQEQFDTNSEHILRPMEKYIELDWRDYKQEELQKCCAIKFEDVNTVPRVLYVFFMIVLVMVGQFFYWNPEQCFGEFPVTGNTTSCTVNATFSKKMPHCLEWTGDDGLFKPAGLIGCCIASGCTLVMWLFGKWRAYKTSHQRKVKEVELLEIEQEWKDKRGEECKAATAKAEAKEALMRSISIGNANTRPLDKE